MTERITCERVEDIFRVDDIYSVAAWMTCDPVDDVWLSGRRVDEWKMCITVDHKHCHCFY